MNLAIRPLIIRDYLSQGRSRRTREVSAGAQDPDPAAFDYLLRQPRRARRERRMNITTTIAILVVIALALYFLA
jgi:hypothetical protein